MSAVILIEFNGKVACLAEHCRDLGVNYGTVQSRHIRTGESYEKCLEYYQENGVKYQNHKYKVKNSRFYDKWYQTKRKCENPKHTRYKYYGGRGIKLCDRWQDYNNFCDDMYESYLKHVKEHGVDDTQLERIDNNGDYEPSNCEWRTHKEQQNNKRNNRMVTEDLNAMQFAKKYNINYNTVLSRLNKGWTAEEIIDSSLRYNSENSS